MYVCMYVCVCVCVCVCMYVCIQLYVRMYINYMNIHIYMYISCMVVLGNGSPSVSILRV